MSTDNLTGTLSSTGNLNGTFGTSGGGGTSNYNDLTNKPQINGNTLEGNKTPAQLGINIPDMSNYYNKSETDALLDEKADASDLPDMSNYYNKSETDTLLDGKANVSDLPDMSNYYNKSETDTLLDGKADASDLPDMSNYYNKSETNTLLNGKQSTILQTTISGTTDNTGDISLTGLPISQYRVLACIKIRNTANPDVAYCVLGGYSTGTSLPYAHLINSANANYANKAVELTVNYIAI